MTGGIEEQKREAAEDASAVPVLKKLLAFALLTAAFLALGTYPPLRAQLQPETLDRTIEGLGWMGAFLLFVLGALTPLLMLPRWPIALVSGMVYGVFWGSCLANTASLFGAGLQYWMAHSTLSHLARRWLDKSRWRHLLENPKNAFSVLFLVRAFPLSNFVATNLLCGTLRIPLRTYLLASVLGMIPSTVLYASWGKFVMKPSGGFLFLVFVTLAFIVLGTVYARRFLTQAARREDAQPL